MSRKLTKAAMAIFLVAIISKLLGILREVLLAYKFGASYITDAYAVAITLPSVIFSVIMLGLTESYIPVYSRITDTKKKIFFTNNLFTIMTLLSAGMGGLCFFLRKPIVLMLAPGFDSTSLHLTNNFIAIILTILPIMAIYNVLVAFMRVKEQFVFTDICTSLVVNFFINVSIVCASDKDPYILIIGYVLSNLIALIMLWIYAKKKEGLKYTPQFKLKNPDFVALVKLAVPFGVSLMVNQLNTVIDRLLASLLGEGLISALNYANKLQLVFFSLTTSIFITVCYPRLNMHFAKGEKGKAEFFLKQGFMLASFIGIPMMFVLNSFSQPLVRFIFEHGSFTSESTIITAQCLSFYALGIPFYSYREVLSRALASNGKQKLILKNTIISILCNIILNLIFIRALEHIGLALSTSMAGCLATVLMYLDVKKCEISFIERVDKIDILKIILISIGAVMIGLFFYNQIMDKFFQTFNLIISLSIMIAFYLVASYIAGIHIFKWSLDQILNRRDKK